MTKLSNSPCHRTEYRQGAGLSMEASPETKPGDSVNKQPHSTTPVLGPAELILTSSGGIQTLHKDKKRKESKPESTRLRQVSSAGHGRSPQTLLALMFLHMNSYNPFQTSPLWVVPFPSTSYTFSVHTNSLSDFPVLLTARASLEGALLILFSSHLNFLFTFDLPRFAGFSFLGNFERRQFINFHEQNPFPCHFPRFCNGISLSVKREWNQERNCLSVRGTFSSEYHYSFFWLIYKANLPIFLPGANITHAWCSKRAEAISDVTHWCCIAASVSLVVLGISFHISPPR